MRGLVGPNDSPISLRRLVQPVPRRQGRGSYDGHERRRPSKRRGCPEKVETDR